MEHILSNKIDHADCLSGQTPKNVKPLGDTVITALKPDEKIKTVMYNVIQEMPDTVQDVKNKSAEEKYIIKMKEKLKNKQV